MKVVIITCALDSAVLREVDRRKYQLTIVDTQHLPAYSDMMNGVECVQPSNSDSLVELSIFESVTSRMIENTGASTCGIDEVILKRGFQKILKNFHGKPTLHLVRGIIMVQRLKNRHLLL